MTRLELALAAALVLASAGLVVMLIARQREAAQRVQCANNLRQLGQATRASHDASAIDPAGKRLPPARLADGFATWAVFLAPYLSKDHPLQQWKLEQSYFEQKPQVREARLVLFFCPARSRSDTLSSAGDTDADGKLIPGALGDYASVVGDGAGPNGALVDALVIEQKDGRIVKWQNRTGLSSLHRGEAYTLLFGEKHVPTGGMADAALGDGSLYNGARPASFARAAGPGFPLARSSDEPLHNNFGSHHSGVCQFVMADTSVRVLTTDTSEDVLGQLSRREE